MHLPIAHFSSTKIVVNTDCYTDAGSIWDRLNDGQMEHTLVVLPPSQDITKKVEYRVEWKTDGSLSVNYKEGELFKTVADFFTDKAEKSELALLQKSLNSKLNAGKLEFSNPKSYLGSWNYYHHNLMRQEQIGNQKWVLFARALPGLLKGELPKDVHQLQVVAELIVRDEKILPTDVKRKELLRAIFAKLDSFSLYGKYVDEAVEALQGNTSIKKLELNLKLESNLGSISPDALEKISTVIRTNQTITSVQLRMFRPVHAPNSLIFKPLLEALRINSTIVTLCLDNFGALDQANSQLLADYVKQNQKLESLTLTKVELDPSTFSVLINHIKDHPGLKHLALDSEITSPDVHKSVLANPGLESYVYTTRNRWGENEAKSLSEALKTNTTLKKLTVEWMSFLDPDEIKYVLSGIKANKGLERVDLNEAKLSKIGSELGDEVAQLIKNNQHLRVLSLWNAGLDDDVAQKIGDALKGQSTLEKLFLESNKWDYRITNLGLIALADGLHENSRLKVLGLHNSMSPGSFSPDVVQAFVGVLETNQVLQSLRTLHRSEPEIDPLLAKNVVTALLDDFAEIREENPTLFLKLAEVGCCLLSSKEYFPPELMTELFKAIIWIDYKDKLLRPSDK